MTPKVRCSKCGNIYTGWALQYIHLKCNCGAPLIYIRKNDVFDNAKIWLDKKISPKLVPGS
jgi:phage FluMu protein Com